MRKQQLLILFSLFFLSNSLQAQIKGFTTIGEKGITVSVKDIIDQSKIDDAKPRKLVVQKEHELKRKPQQNPEALMISRWPEISEPQTLQTEAINATQTIHSNFLGVTLSEGSAIPPDSQGDVGPSQICVISNGRVKFYPKNTVCAAAQTTTTGPSTTALASPTVNVSLNTFFNSVRNAIGTSDPHVRYDRFTQRWFIVCINTAAASNRCLIAVSNGPTITGVASFTFYQFVFDALAGAPAAPYTGGFFDYPTLGLDANALYVGGVMFGNTGSYVGATFFVINKNSIVTGGPMVTTAFHLIGTASAGIAIPQGVQNDDPAIADGYFIGIDQAFFSRLVIHRISTPGGTPTASPAINLNVPATTFPIAQLGQGVPVTGMDALDDRLFAAMLKRNKITGLSTLWTAHNIEVNTSGVGAAGGGRNASRWYEIGVVGALPNLIQSGTLFDNAASNPISYWIPGIAMSGQGHAVIGASTAATNQFPNCGVAGRYRTDASATLQPFVSATAAASNYNQTGTPERWGDYSQTVVDPDNDMTMWTFQEYVNGTNSWGLRVIQLAAPPPATPSLASAIGCGTPSGLNRVSNVTINGNSSNNSEFFDPGADAGGPGFASRLALSSTGSVTVSNLVFVSPTQFTATITWPAAIGGSAQTFTVTNPDCQTITLNYSLPVGCVSLPVRYVSIKGKDIGRRILLSWQTSYEENNAYFEVEKKGTDGKFYPIQVVQAKGNTNGDSYEMIDAKPDGENYYRLKQVNKDFTFHYSDIVLVRIATSGKLNLYPNPAQSTVIVEAPVDFMGGQMRIISISGVTVISSSVKELFQQVNVSALKAGTYIVEIQSPKGVKQRTKLTIEKYEP